MVDVIAKATNELYPTDILFQTPYWAQVKSRLGMEPMAFDILSSETWGDVLVLIRNHCGHKLALVPQGPEHAPDEESYGQYLEDLSVALADRLEPDVAFIRYDLPWKSLYADEMQEQGWRAFPEARIREMRMNMGTRFWNFRKAPTDMTVASSLVVDLDGSEDDILGRMKPKTRYNIGLARRKGVYVQEADSSNLVDFYGLYEQTARRNGFIPCCMEQFSAMFRCNFGAKDEADIIFLLARHGRDILSGAIIGISGQSANFLYGASGNIKRNYMPSSLMHWAGMCMARQRGCLTYEMGAVSPTPDDEHPFNGLHRFKTGFGGRIEFRSGSWDYPLNEGAYRAIQNAETMYRELGA
ncbi:lipid II:glycine glycyltransferase FemX [Desulfovibrio subterraneus]|jgi:lipid II:glycine glycyltransferase (peptidoglycan interpeptide bridge formation enzyme)|uniref:Peptidoglycan bridge formation protein FemAB n=1 Tax=Desulfovibrio subterraneus TaxID=2718620 RepID=A0A7J0BP88_9BACT|nr:peptidoglycan bridge formation glycyltransferase FemA/FemB family protein [Desulfovibrio subterraneus]GFM34975.1 peptidoglycan bridge formation protein FemAB [Desulfovibrio subterraneus]